MVEIYGATHCNFCKLSKDYCESNSIEYTYYNMDDGEFNMRELAERTGKALRTVPQIMIDGQYVGGYNDLVNYYKGS